MAFKEVALIRCPDAELEKHRCEIETPKYKLFVRTVRNQGQAVEICQSLVKEEGIHSILLCAGFTYKNIAQIAEVVGPNVGISVARGDGPSNKVTAAAMEKAGWFQ